MSTHVFCSVCFSAGRAGLGVSSAGCVWSPRCDGWGPWGVQGLRFIFFAELLGSALWDHFSGLEAPPPPRASQNPVAALWMRFWASGHKACADVRQSRLACRVAFMVLGHPCSLFGGWGWFLAVAGHAVRADETVDGSPPPWQEPSYRWKGPSPSDPVS